MNRLLFLLLVVLACQHLVLSIVPTAPTTGYSNTLAAADVDDEQEDGFEEVPVSFGFEDTTESGAEAPGKTASVQFMITHKMRRTLIEELGYLSSEVDEMEPQIAAVVIERSLRRPSSGMPPSWRRPDFQLNDSKKTLHRIQSQLRAVSMQCLTFSKIYIRPVLPALIAASALWVQRDSLAYLLRSAWDGLRRARMRSIAPRNARPEEPKKGFNPFSKPAYSKVDLDALNRVCKLSTWEKVTGFWGSKPSRR